MKIIKTNIHQYKSQSLNFKFAVLYQKTARKGFTNVLVDGTQNGVLRIQTMNYSQIGILTEKENRDSKMYIYKKQDSRLQALDGVG